MGELCEGSIASRASICFHRKRKLTEEDGK